MKHEIAQMWREALLSGAFTQAHRYLSVVKIDRLKEDRPRNECDILDRVTDIPEGPLSVGECCLGVLCLKAADMGAPVTITERVMRYIDADVTIRVFDDRNDFLPPAVQEWAGMNDCRGIYRTIDRVFGRNLAAENDNGKSFAEIAEIIKDHEREL